MVFKAASLAEPVRPEPQSQGREVQIGRELSLRRRSKGVRVVAAILDDFWYQGHSCLVTRAARGTPAQQNGHIKDGAYLHDP